MRATKMIPKLRNISYEMRLKECGLTTLETRRLRGDQIEVFKILTNSPCLRIRYSSGYGQIAHVCVYAIRPDTDK